MNTTFTTSKLQQNIDNLRAEIELYKKNQCIVSLLKGTQKYRQEPSTLTCVQGSGYADGLMSFPMSPPMSPPMSHLLCCLSHPSKKEDTDIDGISDMDLLSVADLISNADLLSEADLLSYADLLSDADLFSHTDNLLTEANVTDTMMKCNN